MSKKLAVIAGALLFTVAAVETTQAVPAPPVTGATVYQTVSTALTVFSGDSYATNKGLTVITSKIKQSSVNTKEVISDIGSALGTKFTSAAKLVYFAVYTNAYNYQVTSTNTSASGSLGISTNFLVSANGSNYSFYVLVPYETSTATNVYPEDFTLGTNLGVMSSNINSNYVIGGILTNNTSVKLLTNATSLIAIKTGIGIVDGTGANQALTVLTNTTAYYPYNPSTMESTNDSYYSIVSSSFGQSPLPGNSAFPVYSTVSGTEKALGGSVIYGTESGMGIGTVSLTLNSPTNLVFSLGGYVSGNIVSKNLGTAKAPVYLDTFEASGPVTGSGFLGGTAESTNGEVWVTNSMPIIIKGSVSMTYWKTIVQ